MTSLSCCYWWFLLGALVGWLASRLYGRSKRAADLPVQRLVQAVAAALSLVAGIDTVAARAAGFKVSGPDNLEVIEGTRAIVRMLCGAANLQSRTGIHRARSFGSTTLNVLSIVARIRAVSLHRCRNCQIRASIPARPPWRPISDPLISLVAILS